MSAISQQERLLTVVIGPVVSEKAHRINNEHNQVVLKVRNDATKPQIKRAVEQLFEVKVDSVRVVNVKGKVKNFGKQRRPGQRSDWKKAYVSLKQGSSLDLLAGA